MRFLVIGAAGHAQEVAWAMRESARARGETCLLEFFDDVARPGLVPSGLGEVVGRFADVPGALRTGDAQLVLGIGLPRTKAAVVARLACPEEAWATVVHPSAIVGPNVTIGRGSYVGAGAVLTVNVRIGRFATVNTHCLASHGDALGDYVTLHPDVHLSGEVRVDEGCELGAGSVVIPGTRIGAWAVLGAGCVAVRDVGGDRTWVGVPARELRAEASRSATRAAQANGVEGS